MNDALRFIRTHAKHLGVTTYLAAELMLLTI